MTAPSRPDLLLKLITELAQISETIRALLAAGVPNTTVQQITGLSRRQLDVLTGSADPEAIPLQRIENAEPFRGLVGQRLLRALADLSPRVRSTEGVSIHQLQAAFIKLCPKGSRNAAPDMFRRVLERELENPASNLTAATPPHRNQRWIRLADTTPGLPTGPPPVSDTDTDDPDPDPFSLPAPRPTLDLAARLAALDAELDA